ncbi:MAG: hypothetical protein NTX73_17600 [Rhodobacterales bacterium]|nr:hypothetical protein [Rhodobacterales bacterium]
MTPVRATLSGEPIKFNDVKSKNSIFKGQVRFADGSLKTCFIKDIGRIEIVNELLSNLIASRLGLPVPRAILALVPNKFVKSNTFNRSPKTDVGVVAFGSIDVQTPNLAQRISSQHPLGQEIIRHSVAKWEKHSYLYGFDTWLANADRNPSNILFGSKSEIWLIDHGQCFTKEDWKPADLIADQKYPNKLFWLTKFMNHAERKKAVDGLTIAQSAISILNMKDIFVDSLVDSLTNAKERKAIMDFLTGRVQRVASDGADVLQP